MNERVKKAVSPGNRVSGRRVSVSIRTFVPVEELNFGFTSDYTPAAGCERKRDSSAPGAGALCAWSRFTRSKRLFFLEILFRDCVASRDTHTHTHTHAAGRQAGTHARTHTHRHTTRTHTQTHTQRSSTQQRRARACDIDESKNAVCRQRAILVSRRTGICPCVPTSLKRQNRTLSVHKDIY